MKKYLIIGLIATVMCPLNASAYSWTPSFNLRPKESVENQSTVIKSEKQLEKQKAEVLKRQQKAYKKEQQAYEKQQAKIAKEQAKANKAQQKLYDKQNALSAKEQAKAEKQRLKLQEANQRAVEKQETYSIKREARVNELKQSSYEKSQAKLAKQNEKAQKKQAKLLAKQQKVQEKINQKDKSLTNEEAPQKKQLFGWIKKDKTPQQNSVEQYVNRRIELISAQTEPLDAAVDKAFINSVLLTAPTGEYKRYKSKFDSINKKSKKSDQYKREKKARLINNYTKHIAQNEIGHIAMIARLNNSQQKKLVNDADVMYQYGQKYVDIVNNARFAEKNLKAATSKNPEYEPVIKKYSDAIYNVRTHANSSLNFSNNLNKLILHSGIVRDEL